MVDYSYHVSQARVLPRIQQRRRPVRTRIFISPPPLYLLTSPHHKHRALRGMIAEFIFFMCIAAICFSGLLFTLWTLASDKWKLKSIAWLMVQIWFGNTYLSFGQAESFHPVFGPILMTGFAALSNTLLLTSAYSLVNFRVAVSARIFSSCLGV